MRSKLGELAALRGDGPSVREAKYNIKREADLLEREGVLDDADVQNYLTMFEQSGRMSIREWKDKMRRDAKRGAYNTMVLDAVADDVERLGKAIQRIEEIERELDKKEEESLYDHELYDLPLTHGERLVIRVSPTERYELNDARVEVEGLLVVIKKEIEKEQNRAMMRMRENDKIEEQAKLMGFIDTEANVLKKYQEEFERESEEYLEKLEKQKNIINEYQKKFEEMSKKREKEEWNKWLDEHEEERRWADKGGNK